MKWSGYHAHKVGKTRVINNTLDPTWNHPVLVPVPLDIPECGELSVELFDSDFLGKDEFLGQITLDADDLLQPRASTAVAAGDAQLAPGDPGQPARCVSSCCRVVVRRASCVVYRASFVVRAGSPCVVRRVCASAARLLRFVCSVRAWFAVRPRLPRPRRRSVE